MHAFICCLHVCRDASQKLRLKGHEFHNLCLEWRHLIYYFHLPFSNSKLPFTFFHSLNCFMNRLTGLTKLWIRRPRDLRKQTDKQTEWQTDSQLFHACSGWSRFCSIFLPRHLFFKFYEWVVGLHLYRSSQICPICPRNVFVATIT